MFIKCTIEIIVKTYIKSYKKAQIMKQEKVYVLSDTLFSKGQLINIKYL